MIDPVLALVAPMSVLALAALTLGGLNAFQAVAGKRLSKEPSMRSDAVMRRQSATAGVVLVALSVLLMAMLGAMLTVR
ncbi:hypothetical protein [Cellulomonas rhizosphaerae]|uniref:Uncharacterized protein n=1 Tax=Cellulomonas rhizosphaerae TaxID=2293719 RepID=A0A413RKR6_9CELL|nr:hypothetical protein [Cellulomonas rhizosphaerae]RHA39942.1 hypothetical protein D1825_11010 [Cellulomonas rhizosphaerae]